MKLFWKRSLAMILAVLMVVTILPATVFAEDDTSVIGTETEATETTTNPTNNNSDQATNDVVEISNADDLASAFKFSVTFENGMTVEYSDTDGGSDGTLGACLDEIFNSYGGFFGEIACVEIMLNADVTIDETVTIPADKEVILNLNGFDITSGYQPGSTTKHIYPLNVYGNLTIKDTKGNGSVTGRGIFVQAGSKLTIDSGSIYAIDSNGGSALWMYGGDVVINGGHIEQKAEGTYNFAINAPAGTVTVNGGWVGGNHGAIAAGGAAVVINGGELVCTGTAGMTDNVLYTYDTGSITINGGTFVADNDGPAGGACVYDANGKVTINGGTFGNSSGGDVWGTTGTTIKGGTFENLTEKQHIADGYELNDDGSVVTTTPPVVLNAQTVLGTIKVETVNGDNLAYVLGRLDVASNLFPLAGGVKIVEIEVNSDVVETETVTIKYNTVISGEGAVSGTIVVNYGATLTVSDTVGIENLNIVDEQGNAIVAVDGVYAPVEKTYVAEVNGVQYTDLQEAIKAAAPDGTVELLCDVTVDKWVMMSEQYIMGGDQLINVVINGMVINGNGHTLTVKTIESAGNGNHLFDDARNLTVKDLTIVNESGKNGGIGLISGTISNVTFIGGVGVYPMAGGQVTITGCTFKTNDAIYFETDRDGLVVTGCTFDVGTNYAIILRGAAKFINNTVTSGKVNVANSATGEISNNNFGDNRFKVYNGANATITGNTINNLVFNDATVAGSTFENNTLSESAQAALDAVTATYVAEINGVQYTDLQEAIKAAQNGDTIVLLADLEVIGETFTIAADKAITLDMNGKKITATDNKAASVSYELFYNYGELTVIGNGTIELTSTSNDTAYAKSSTIFHNRGGVLTIENGTFKHLGGTAMAFVVDNSANSFGDAYLYVNGGEIISENYIAIRMRMEDPNANGNPGNGLSIAEVTGGYIYGANRGIWGQKSSGANEKQGNLTVTGGVVENKRADRGAIQIDTDSYEAQNMLVSISDNATIKGAIMGGDDEFVVSGGIFTVAVPEKYCAEGFVCKQNADGTYGIEKGLTGSGTEEDPYLINDIDDLIWFRDKVNTYTSDGSNQFKGEYVKLTADIDLDGINWTPIGTNSVGDHMAFLGHFDGDGHTISNLYINADGGHLGFFARVGSYNEAESASVMNLILCNVDVSTNVSDHWTTGHGDYVAGLIANAGGNTTVSGVTLEGYIYIDGCAYVGGIVGHGYTKIDNCSVNAAEGSYILSGYWSVGAIMGYGGEGTTITNCTVSGDADEPLYIWGNYGAAAAVLGNARPGSVGTDLTASNVTVSGDDYALGYVFGNSGTLTNVSATNVILPDGAKASDAVATADGVVYFDIKSAFEAGGEVKLLKDVTITNTLKVLAGQVVVLDLNGKAIDAIGYTRIAIMSYGNLTIKDTSAEQTGTIKAGKPYDNGKPGGNTINVCAGTFTLESGNIYSQNNGILIDEEAATVTINGGTITAETTTIDSAAIYISSTTDTVVNIHGGEFVGYKGIIFWNNTTLNITGGTITGTVATGIQGNGSKDNTNVNISGDASIFGAKAGIYHPQGGNMTISGNATITGSTGVVVKGGNVTISGGNINGTGALGGYAPNGNGFDSTGDALYVEHYDNSPSSDNYGTPVVTVTGGTFTSVNGKAVASYANPNNNVEALTSFVSGGTFNTDVSELCADGFVCEQNVDGTYGVQEDPTYGKVAKIGDTYYATLAEAIAAAQAGETVKLIADVTLDAIVVIEKAIILDLNGYTVTGANKAVVFQIKADTTIDNGKIAGNKTGTSSGLLEIYANLNMNGVTVETSSIKAMAFKVGGFTAVLTDCTVTGGLKGYGASVWQIYGGTYYVGSSASSEHLNGTVEVYGGTFHYELRSKDCAPGYEVVDNGDGTWTVAYNPACFVDTNNNGVLDDGEAVYGSLDEIFETIRSGDVYIVLLRDVEVEKQVDTNVNAKYYLNAAEGVTVTFKHETGVLSGDVAASQQAWNFIQNMYIGENVTLNAKYMLLWGDVEIAGTVNTTYLYALGATVDVLSTGKVNVNSGEATVQVKTNTTFTVDGELNTTLLQVWTENAKLIINGEVSARTIRAWDENPSIVVADDATVNAKFNLSDNAIVQGPADLDITTDVADHKIAYENGEYKIVEKTYVAQIGDAKYESLAEALAAAQAGETVTLLADVVLDDTITIEKSITLDGDGHKLLPIEGKTYNSAIMAGNSGWGDNHGETIKLVDLDISGFNTNYGAVRAQGVTLEMTDCVLNENSVSNYAYAVVSLNYTNATISGCEFKNNNDRAIDVNYNGDSSQALVTIDGCTFDGNTTTDPGIVMRSAGKIAVKNSVFTNNTVNTNGNGATLYVGFGAGNEVSGCTFEGNTVTTSHTTTKRFASAIFCDGCVVSENVFGEGNTAVRNGETISTVVAVGAYYGAAEISGNYWGGNAPVPGVDYTIEYTRNDVAVDTYYADAEFTNEVTITYVAKAGKYSYTTLQAAIDAAQDGETVTLLDDVNEAVTISGKEMTLDLAGHVLSGTCNASQSTLVYVENGAKLTVEDSVGNGKITYAQGTSNVGWTVDVKGEFVLESGTIELTGSWSIGYAVDVRPNSWGTEYTTGTKFTMNGGSIVSSDGGVRVASSSAEGHKNVSASFVMNGGLIDAAWDGVFVQQSDAIYDDLSFTMNDGTIESDLNPVRVYGPAPTGYVNDQDCMSISLAGGTMTYTGTETYTWVIEGILRVGGGSSVETVLGNGELVVAESIAQNTTAPEDYKWVSTENGYTLKACDYVAQIGEQQKFESLADAIAAAQNGQTIVLLKDIDLGNDTLIVSNVEVVLDLNGYTISGSESVTLTSNDALIRITKGGKLTIKDSSEEKTGTITYGYTGGATGWGGYSASTIENNQGTLIVESGKIVSTTNIANQIAYAINSLTNGTLGDAYVTINGGEIIAAGSTAVRQFANSTTCTNSLVITGGKITGRVQLQSSSINNNKGELSITGGEIIREGNTAIEVWFAGGENSEYSNTVVSIGGNVKVTGNVVFDEAPAQYNTKVITGGTFSSDVSALCADGFKAEANSDGTYGIVVANYVAEVNGVKYESFADAYVAANAGETITLLAPIVVEAGETLTLDKDVTITYTSSVVGEDMITVYGTLNVAAGKITYVNNSNGSNVTVSTISAVAGSVVNVTGGSIENKSVAPAGSSSYAYAIDMLTNGSMGDVTVNISGGTVYSDYMAIRQFNNGDACKNTLNVTGGYIYGAKRAIQIHMDNNAAYLEISGGKIEAGEGGYALCLFNKSNTVSVTGGEFDGDVWFSGESGFVSGGTFTMMYEEYVDEEYILIQNTDGTYGVRKANYVAEINGVKYESISDAFNAAGSGDTVKLLANVNDYVVVVPAGVTLDLNGNVYTADMGVFSYGDIIDTATDNADATAFGGIVISSNMIVHLQPNNTYMPLYDAQAGCYRFFSYEIEALLKDGTDQQITTGVRVLFDNREAYRIVANGGSALTLKLYMTWTNRGGDPISYTYSESKFMEYASKAYTQSATDKGVTTALAISITGLNNIAGKTLILSTSLSSSTMVAGMQTFEEYAVPAASEN